MLHLSNDTTKAVITIGTSVMMFTSILICILVAYFYTRLVNQKLGNTGH